MNKNIILFLVAAGLLLLVGCAKESGTADVDSITVEASIGQMTKVSYDGDKTAFTAGDKIAVYGWIGNADEVPDTRVVNGVVNTLGTDGKWTPESQMLWKNVRDEHYFLGVFPARTITNFKADEYILDPSKYTESDLLIATSLTGIKAQNNPVALTFDHAMAKLVVNLKFRSQWETAPAVTAVSATAKKTATVDYLAKALTATGTAEAVALTATSNVAWSGLQVPQEGVRKISVTIDNKEYIFESATDIPLKSGEITVLSLTVGRDRIDLGSMTVTDWEAGTTLPEGEAEEYLDMLHTPLTLETVNPGTTMNVTFLSTLSKSLELQYSLDGGESWKTMTIAAGKPEYYDQSNNKHEREIDPLVITGVERILLKAANESYGECSSIGLENPTDVVERNLRIDVNTDCYIYGNLMSLVAGDQFATRIDLKEERTFEEMFFDNAKLKSHPDKKLSLPATTLTNNCYRRMFMNCTSLTVAPDLPATELTKNCYSCMFSGCSALTATPALPATTLEEYCYYSMFRKCKALTSASVLPATTLAANCYQNMFQGCTALTKAPELMATFAANYSCDSMFEGCSALKTAPSRLAATVANHCYQSMFQECTSLESAPELPAMTMESYCYAAMFRDCHSLETVPALLPATTLAKHCYDSMFFNSKDANNKLKKAPALPATTLAECCYYYMFAGCIALTNAPDLPAKELKSGCYMNMFYKCTSLNYVKCLATSIEPGVNDSPTYNWVSGVSNSGSFVKDASAEYGYGKFWDTTTQYGSTTSCAAIVFYDRNWTVSDAN